MTGDSATDHDRRSRRVDPVALAAGLAALWGAGFFLLVDEPSLSDQAGWLWPAMLIILGVTLVVATARRR
jgi:hypothetical protein